MIREMNGTVKKAVCAAMMFSSISGSACAAGRSAAEIAGQTAGDVSAASTTYGYDRYRSFGGPGFTAEDANHMHDWLRGRDARLVGHDNAKNGADRMVDGQLIQTKYYPTGSRCVEQCFDGRGTFRYLIRRGGRCRSRCLRMCTRMRFARWSTRFVPGVSRA